MRTRYSALMLLAGCSAATDFDYSFRGTSERDAAQDAQSLDATQGTLDAQADARSSDEGGSSDTATPDASCVPLETRELTCAGGLDEDCDGLVDCQDSDCRQSAVCCPDPKPESGDTACTDEVDNDCDGVLDCDEPGCKGVYECSCVKTGPEDQSFPASCTDGNDNDCDRAIDCAENSCAFSTQCCTKTDSREFGASCNDGINNDCDADGADCADPDCRMSTDAGSVASESGSLCGDRLDNDCDGRSDCEDSDCRAELLCCRQTESRETSCNDGANNDCDAQGADCYDDDCALDPSCCRPVAGGERTQALCTDRKDNDCDGLVDCDDPQCGVVRVCCIANLEANKQILEKTETSCIDSYDNDCDGALNCKDSDCDGYKFCGGIIVTPIDPPVTVAQ